MLAKRVGELPVAGTWIFEPKWDGFRALVFRDAEELLIQSRDEKPLNRYFPELLEPLRSQLPARCVLDGEIVVARNGALDFEALQLRIHPAESRVKLLSQEIPASIVFFDLLSEGERDLRSLPFQERRQILESLLSSAGPPIHLTPATSEFTVAAEWFRHFEGAGLDGVVAKPISGTYEPNKRVMLKVKHERDCDCVVGGFRWHKKGERTFVAHSCWPVRQCRRVTARRRVRELYRQEAQRACRLPRAIPRTRARRPPVERVGCAGAGKRSSHPWSPESLEPRQGHVMGATASRAGGPGRLRPHAGQPLPSHSAVSQVAYGQEAERLHLCAT